MRGNPGASRKVVCRSEWDDAERGRSAFDMHQAVHDLVDRAIATACNDRVDAFLRGLCGKQARVSGLLGHANVDERQIPCIEA